MVDRDVRWRKFVDRLIHSQTSPRDQTVTWCCWHKNKQRSRWKLSQILTSWQIYYMKNGQCDGEQHKTWPNLSTFVPLYSTEESLTSRYSYGRHSLHCRWPLSTDYSIVFTRWLAYWLAYVIYGSLDHYENEFASKRHLNRFGRFCTVHGRDQHTDTLTDHATSTCLFIARI